MTGNILVLNSGSSSIKFALFEPVPEPELLLRGAVENIGTHAIRIKCADRAGKQSTVPLTKTDGAIGHDQALSAVIEYLQSLEQTQALTAVGHRVVHGGMHFREPLVVTAELLEELDGLAPLAPLHQPHNLKGIRALSRLCPSVPQVVCFDTAFHRSAPKHARHFALPSALTDAGVQRFGFHGLSYEYIADVLPGIAGGRAQGKVVVAHLGNGASMCAMRGLLSMDTTMSFTALDGLPMGTRCGALDPGAILYLLDHMGLDTASVSDLLYNRSGLLGISGISGNMRELLKSRSAAAKEAVDYFVYRTARELGALAAVLQGLDVLVFTGGIGENAVSVRERVCAQSDWLGIRLDIAANTQNQRRISADASAVDVYVIPTNEELVVARHVSRLVPHPS